ncbi:hypothetical protein ILYODFUR_030352 [Ilyodon furcidens]|uniref:Uncharacterized protein n=1 Tax=Ilyodon furcidens TaxID=33524 RepID=A0ABV0T571_9TELE
MALDQIDSPLAEDDFLSQIHSHLRDTADQKKQHYESCSEEAAHTAVRTLIDLGVSDSLPLLYVCVSVNLSAVNYSATRH